MAIDWADSPFRDKTIAELVHEFGYIRGDLCEQATRDFFVEIVEHHLEDAWEEGAEASRAVLRTTLDVLANERFDFHFKRPREAMLAAGTTSEDFEKGYARALHFAVTMMETALAGVAKGGEQ